MKPSQITAYTRIHRRYLRHVKEGYGKYWKNHFSTIGIVGVNEAVINLLGQNIASKDGQAFAVKMLTFMRKRLADYQEETGSIYNLEATPAEGTSYRLARIDKKRYRDIIFANQKQIERRTCRTILHQLFTVASGLLRRPLRRLGAPRNPAVTLHRRHSLPHIPWRTLALLEIRC